MTYPRHLLLLFLTLACCWPQLGLAGPTHAFLSESQVRLTTTFHGLELDIVGFAAEDEEGRLPDVLIHIFGPPATHTLRRKQRIMGLWFNGSAREINELPSYQWILATPGADRRLDAFATLSEYRLGAGAEVLDTADWQAGLRETLERGGTYGVDMSGVQYRDGGLYNGKAFLPSTLLPGSYEVAITLAYADGTIQSRALAFDAERARISALVTNMIEEQPLLYALLSILIALAAGYTVALAFRR